MKRLTFIAALALAFVVAAPTTSYAQVEFGPRVGLPLGDYSADLVEDAGLESTFLIGAELRFAPPALPFGIAVIGDYYFTDPPQGFDTSAFLFGADALFPFGIDNQVFTPYLGVGPRLSFNTIESTEGDFEESATNFGLGARFGAQFGLGSVSPFIELGYDLILNGKVDEEGSSLENIERATASVFGLRAGLLFGL